MYQSKISKMKRKSSEDNWEIAAVVLSFFILFTILTFALRIVMISGSYGQVPLEIPLVSATIKDPGFHNFQEKPREMIRKATPAVVMTPEAFFFGDLDSFSSGLSDSANKFVVPHENGVPQVGTLTATMDVWLRERAQIANVPLSQIIVFIPAGSIPMPIVIQVVAGLRKSPLFQHVILSNGLI